MFCFGSISPHDKQLCGRGFFCLSAAETPAHILLIFRRATALQFPSATINKVRGAPVRTGGTISRWRMARGDPVWASWRRVSSWHSLYLILGKLDAGAIVLEPVYAILPRKPALLYGVSHFNCAPPINIAERVCSEKVFQTKVVSFEGGHKIGFTSGERAKFGLFLKVRSC